MRIGCWLSWMVLDWIWLDADELKKLVAYLNHLKSAGATFREQWTLIVSDGNWSGFQKSHQVLTKCKIACLPTKSCEASRLTICANLARCVFLLNTFDGLSWHKHLYCWRKLAPKTWERLRRHEASLEHGGDRPSNGPWANSHLDLDMLGWCCTMLNETI